ncbi:hypothetical protein [Bradyrhizobium sp. JYMT SZCCT0428]|uniref:hypothetical protein n=1 Tax=Bradyrhizobium sp. JYMT SZCCT0428 TaxID=2807673 RepID=UPI001BA84A7F|nr:hypothetical protein [Bradyrhizobium sp. JYMT SZCCT0428]MBR1151716.1 hypothetical protein [Bradyrhizobium sp. JYMT SZCCT0428]
MSPALSTPEIYPMKRRTKVVLLVSGLLVAAAASTAGVLTVALAKVLDPYDYCATGYSPLVVPCALHWSSQTTTQGTPAIPSNTPPKFQGSYTDKTAWAIADCPQNAIGRRLLCSVSSDAKPAEAASDDLVSGLPRPKPWVVTTGKSSRFIDAVHVETPLDLAGTLRFYREALAKRGWTENEGAVIERDKATITFATKDGPAQLRLTRQGDRTIADLSQRKPADADGDILPMPGQMRLRLGNGAKEAAVITVNQQTINLAAGAGESLTDDAHSGRKSPNGRKSICRPANTRSASSSRAARRTTGSSSSLPARPGASWSARTAPRSLCSFIDVGGSARADVPEFSKKSGARPASPRSRPTSPVYGAGGMTGFWKDSQAGESFQPPSNLFVHG